MRGKLKNLISVLIFILAFAFPLFSFANQVVVYNGTVTKITKNTLTVDVIVNTGADANGTATGRTDTYSLAVSKGSDYTVGDLISFSWDRDAGKLVPGTVSKTADPNANAGIGSNEIASTGLSDGTVTFKLFNKTCLQSEALTCWIGFAFGWAQGAILLLAVGAIIVAGLIYMTSAGNPKRIAMAKKMIIGALSGVAVIVLGRFFLTKVIGVPWL